MDSSRDSDRNNARREQDKESAGVTSSLREGSLMGQGFCRRPGIITDNLPLVMDKRVISLRIGNLVRQRTISMVLEPDRP